jgi:hypothetical protein
MTLYDTNGDSVLDKQELAGCPGILASLSLYDKDGDSVVNKDEVAARIGELYASRVGLTQVTARVSFQGQPLRDALVTFEPEPYLGEGISTAQGTTDQQGSAAMGIDPDEVPESLRKRKVLRCGTYKVRITHPKVVIPPKYNQDSVLGFETQLGNPFATFSLKAQ